MAVRNRHAAAGADAAATIGPRDRRAWWRRWLAGAALGWLGLWATACGGAPASRATNGPTGQPASPSLSLAQLATYQKPDRQKVLVAQAQREGSVVFYTTNTWQESAVVKGFEQRYPQIKVQAYRGDTQDVVTRITQAAAAHKRLVDVVEAEPQGLQILVQDALLQSFTSPELSAYPSSAVVMSGQDALYWEDREIYVGLGYNTNQIPVGQQPKTLQDLLSPRWKGKMVLAGSSTGVNWIGTVLRTLGQSYVDQLRKQNVRVQDISGAALAQLVAAGQVALSPTIFNSNVQVLQKKGKPIAWQPLPPVDTNTGYSGIVKTAPHPAAALLFLDYLHSQEGQKIGQQGGLSSARKDMASPATSFQKFYFERHYTEAQYLKQFKQWQGVLKQDFISG